MNLEEARKKAEAEKKRRGTPTIDRGDQSQIRKQPTNPRKKKPNWSKRGLKRPSKPSRLKPKHVPTSLATIPLPVRRIPTLALLEGARRHAAARPNVPDRPDVIAPAGPRVAPEKTKLAGPKVVRIEKPDPVGYDVDNVKQDLPGSAPATPAFPSVGRSSPGGGCSEHPSS